MPHAADPKGAVEPQAVRLLAAVAVTAMAIDLLLVAAFSSLNWDDPPKFFRPYSWLRDTLTVSGLAWRGSWIGLLFLWSIGVSPWRPSGGQPAIVILVALLLLASAASAFNGAELLWGLGYGGAVAVWLLVARLFGVRIGHGAVLREPIRLRWSLLTIIATVTFAAIVAGIWMAIWRSWVFERETRREFLTGLLQLILMIVMVASFSQAALLVIAFRWRWANYASLVVGPCLVVATLAIEGRGEMAGIAIFSGFCLLANGVLSTVLHYYGWRVFLDTPVWDRKRDVRF